MNTFSIKESFHNGWVATRQHFAYLIGLTVLFFLSMFVLSLFSPVPVIGFLISLAGQTILGIGIVKITLALSRGEQPSYKTLFTTVAPFWRFLGATLLAALIVALGMILLVVPGFIFALSLFFVKYIVVDTQMGIVEALKESARITKGNRWRLLGFALVMGVINLLGVFLIGVGLLFTIPVSLMATVDVYNKLKGAAKEPAVAASAPAPAKPTTSPSPSMPPNVPPVAKTPTSDSQSKPTGENSA